MLPTEARTTFGLYTSTESLLKITASAPNASAHRTTVPALPGSRIGGPITTSDTSRRWFFRFSRAGFLRLVPMSSDRDTSTLRATAMTP